MGFRVNPQAINVRECNVYLSNNKSKNFKCQPHGGSSEIFQSIHATNVTTKQVCFVCMLMVWPDDDSSSQCSHCKVNEPISIDVQNAVKTLTEIPQTCRKTGCRQTLERERETHSDYLCYIFLVFLLLAELVQHLLPVCTGVGWFCPVRKTRRPPPDGHPPVVLPPPAPWTHPRSCRVSGRELNPAGSSESVQKHPAPPAGWMMSSGRTFSLVFSFSPSSAMIDVCIYHHAAVYSPNKVVFPLFVLCCVALL